MSAWPMADGALTQELLDLVQQASHYRQLKKGANESTKALSRGVSELIVLAGDTQPLSILLHLPNLCEDKNVPPRPRMQCQQIRDCCLSVSITTNEASELQNQIRAIKDKVERLMI
ncbi:hypothetical protein RRF57_007828 [Xylaria bambusicola]|uniref:H/ACA ribonucleoprotein complex subunit 2 n=1 Tax=Xylaria bambusicola TaxID=326684 RepID=A0AAN7UVZ6_9PEZI